MAPLHASGINDGVCMPSDGCNGESSSHGDDGVVDDGGELDYECVTNSANCPVSTHPGSSRREKLIEAEEPKTLGSTNDHHLFENGASGPKRVAKVILPSASTVPSDLEGSTTGLEVAETDSNVDLSRDFDAAASIGDGKVPDGRERAYTFPSVVLFF